MFKNIDKQLEKLGFKKVSDDQHIVSYERYNAIRHFTHVVNLCHKQHTEHIIQSYDKELFDAKGIGNTCVGLSYKETKLFLKKMRKKGWHKRK